MSARLVPTGLLRWRQLVRGEYNKATAFVGGEPSILQQYWRDENTDWDQETEGKGAWRDIPIVTL
jgi:hypothetical protein